MRPLLAAIALATAVTSCTSGGPKVLARRDPAYSLSAANSIAVSTHRQPRPEDAAVIDALKAELARRGFTLTNAAAADYVAAGWVEENWNAMRPAGAPYYNYAEAPMGVKTYEGSPVTAPGSLTVGVTDDGRAERYLVTQGIRLELYPRDKSGRTGLSPAWTGYIEAGSQLRADHTAALVHTLLDYFGEDFTGRAKPAE